MKNHTLDATNKKLGRIASEIAKILMGKDLASFKRNEIPAVTVTVENASKIDITAKKLSEKRIQRYSGYPGGLKILSVKQMTLKKGYSELLKKAVFGMLPTNRLRHRMIKQLIIKE